MARFGYNTLLALITSVGVLFTSGCGLTKEASVLTASCSSSQALARLTADTGAAGAATNAFGVFKTVVHPRLVRSCSGCHTSGARQAPGYFGESDSSVSYFDASRRMNFSDPAAPSLSRLYQLGTDGHCRNCEAFRNKRDFEIALREWAVAEKADASPNHCPETSVAPTATPPLSAEPTPTPDPYAGVTFSTAVALPSGLSTGNTQFQRVRIPLDSLGHTGSILELGILKYTDAFESTPASYLIAEPRLYARNTAVYLRGLRVYLKAEQSSGTGNGTRTMRKTNNGFQSLETIVPRAPANLNLATRPLALNALSTQADIIEGFFPQSSPGTGTEIQVSFEALIADIATAPEEVVFAAFVAPVLTTRCQNCHGAANRYDLSGGSSSDHDATLRYVAKTEGANSPLFRYARDGQNHPGGAPLAGRTTEINAILTWINRL